MTADVSHTVERIGPLHSLYVGSGPTGNLSPDNQRRIIDLCGEAFPSFTCIEARGYFRRQAEETLVIHIASSDVERLLGLARDIATAHEKLGIGLAGPEPGGNLVYQRIIHGGNMAWKPEPGLRLAIRVILEVRSRYQSGGEGWDACDEILHDIHIETDGRSMEIAESLDDLPH